jgi:hypothetical protein
MDNNVRLRKEYKISNKSQNFKTTFGTTNRVLPSVIYLKMDTWVKYTGDIKDYNEKINSLNSNIRFNIKNEIRNAVNFTDIYFYTPNIKKVMLNVKNPFHACFEITLKQKEPIIYEISLLEDKLKIFSDNIINIIERTPHFEFNIKK